MSFQNEGEMYNIMKNFLIEKKGCIKKYTHYTYANGAEDGIIVALEFLGSSINPDIYGLTSENIVYLCEGKLDCKGRRLDETIWQGISNQRFCHFSYIFFPQEYFETKSDLLEHIKSLCSKENLGLALVWKKEEVDEEGVEEIIPPKLSTFLNKDNLTEWTKTMSLISRASEKLKARSEFEVADTEVWNARAYLIRDLCYLIAKIGLGSTENEIVENFKREIQNYFKNNIPEQNYWSAQAYGGPKDYAIDKRPKWNLSGARALGLLDASFKLTDLGNGLYIATDENEVGTPKFSNSTRAFFFSLALKYEEVKIAVEEAKRIGEKIRWTSFHCPECKKNAGLVGKNPSVELDSTGEPIHIPCQKLIPEKFRPLQFFVQRKTGNFSWLYILQFFVNSEILPFKQKHTFHLVKNIKYNPFKAEEAEETEEEESETAEEIEGNGSEESVETEEGNSEE